MHDKHWANSIQNIILRHDIFKKLFLLIYAVGHNTNHLALLSADEL